MVNQSLKIVEEFDVVENKDGELMFVMNELGGKPFLRPTMTVGDDDSATMLRDKDFAINLKDIPKEAFAVLANLKQVKVAEMAENGDFAHVYDVDITR